MVSVSNCARIAMLVALIIVPLPAFAQVTSAGNTYKVAWWNIQSGKGEPAMAGHPALFPETANCTDPSLPLNAWGINFIQPELIEKIGNDPAVLAFGLGEAWKCGSPNNVKTLLGWKAASSEKNGVAILARHGFKTGIEWFQLDTSLNENPADTKWIGHAQVCADAACSTSVDVFVAHWYGKGTYSNSTYDKQAKQSLAFMNKLPAGTPHVLVGDLNVWEGPSRVCAQNPKPTYLLDNLRNAGYIDAWRKLRGSEAGYTGMTNRTGCGVPEGNTWKRIDYAWSRNVAPVSITRFMMPDTPGDATYSDHYGIIAEYPFEGGAPVPPPDVTRPTVAMTSPAEAATVSGTATVTASATDASGIARVEFLADGQVIATDSSAPFSTAWDTRAVSNGSHMLQTRAYDAVGNMGESLMRTVTVANTNVVDPPVQGSADDIVIHAAAAKVVGSAWQLVDDAQAASGRKVLNRDANAPKVAAPLVAPASYVDLTFTADKGKAYRLWIRGRAERDYYANDSAFVQFSDSVDASGAPLYRIGTTSATTYVLEDCSGCGLAGWGWQDNGYGAGVLGTVIRFATTGTHTIRIQAREDGLSFDQIVLSAVKYVSAAPGAAKNDTTILPLQVPMQQSVSTTEIVLQASAAKVVGAWRIEADATAASGRRLRNPDAAIAKVASASAAPTSYAEVTFSAEKGRPYRLWMRGRADLNSWANDSAFVQFSDSVDANGQPIYRIGTTSSTTYLLEDCSGCGLAGWGWQDNGYGTGVLGPVIYFATTGTHTLRIQSREDGLAIDQIVLSSEKYLSVAPGAAKNDTTVLAQ
jgi:exonuclease III